MAVDISRSDFVSRFGFDPFKARDGKLGLDLRPGAPVPEGEGPSPFDEQAAQYQDEQGNLQPQYRGVEPPQAPGTFPMPQVGGNQLPDPYQAGGPPAVENTASGPPGLSPGGLPRILVQREVTMPLMQLVLQKPETLGEHGYHLKSAADEGAGPFLQAYYGILEQDPEFQKLMVVYSQELTDKPLPEDFGQKLQSAPDDMLEQGVMANQDPERVNALRVGQASATDLARMADLTDEAIGRSDGLNEKFRMDFVSMAGVARHKILEPLVRTGDLDAATKFDSLLDAFQEDTVGLAGQGYHPNAVPLRIALQYRLELDKNPDLMEDSGYGKALRQLRGLFKAEIEDKMSRSAGLSQAVSPAEWRHAMMAYEQAFEIAKKTEPDHYRRRPQ